MLPQWVSYMILSCVAAFIVGWIAGFVIDEWKNR